MAKKYKQGDAGKEIMFAAFDLETDGFYGKVLCASYRKEGDTTTGYISTGNIVEKLFNIMAQNTDYIWYAHNSQYEFIYLPLTLI